MATTLPQEMDMTATQALAFPEENLLGWERALYAFLVEKERRSGSMRTVQGYSRMLQDFFGRVGKPPDKVTPQEVFVWAHGRGLSGKDPSPVTTGARIACLSSFFRFLIRMDVVSRNPCDKLERPRTSTPPARGLSAEDVRRLLAVIPNTPQGLRDRAIILTLVLTGRRESCHGQPSRRYEPHSRPSARIWGMWWGPSESLWPSPAAVTGEGLRSATFYGRFRRYLQKAGLPPSGLHVLRHTAAKLRRDAGESIEEVSRFLDHCSLAVTTTYLRRLEGQEDLSWRRVAEAIGV